MSEVLANEIWSELKRFVNAVDRAEAAETMVQILMDNDSDVEDIRTAFKGDSDIKRALTAFYCSRPKQPKQPKLLHTFLLC